jgi:hypothetical protein
MNSFPSTQSQLQAYTYRTYDDQWHGSRWDESTQHEHLPSLVEVLRGMLSRRTANRGA